MRRRDLLWLPPALAVSAVAPTVIGQQQGWELRFLVVEDLLEVRVGGPRGPLITFRSFGRKGAFTWTIDDPRNSVQGIDYWVGDNPVIRLWARILRERSPYPRCVMETLYAGYVRQRWQFESYAEYEIRR